MGSAFFTLYSPKKSLFLKKSLRKIVVKAGSDGDF